MENNRSYLERKHGEISLLYGCLSTPLNPARPESIAGAIELKFRLAARVKADRLVKCGSMTETARSPSRWQSSGPFAFSFGYQRADLAVSGPSVYPILAGLAGEDCASTIYTGSGMSAIAALLLGLLRFNRIVDIVAPIDCYAETRELMNSLDRRIRQHVCDGRATGIDPATRVTTFQHGLYLTIAPGGDASTEQIKLAASEMASEMATQGLPVKHAGSFGFDFVAVEWCPDAIDGTNSLRVCGGDLPLALADEMGRRITTWCLRRGSVISPFSRHEAANRLPWQHHDDSCTESSRMTDAVEAV